MNWPEYADYKESSAPWLGEIPEDWTITHIKNRFNITLGKMLNAGVAAKEGSEVSYLRAGNIQPHGLDLSVVKSTHFTLVEQKTLTLRKGDLVVVEGGAGFGRSAVLMEGLAGWGFQNHVMRIRPTSDDLTSYLNYALLSLNATGHISTLSNHATIPSLSADKLGRILTPFPSLEVQTAIVSFLDRETAKIDALIGKQEQLIATLREDRAATIAHTVTRGLDPTVEVQDSGAGWIEDVAAEWTFGRVKHGFSVVLGKMYQGASSSPSDTFRPHLKAGSITETLEVDPADPMECWFSPEELSKLSIRAGDLFVVEGGATYGRSAIVREDLPGWGFQKSLNRVRPLNGDDIRFVDYLIQTANARGHISILCGKATIPHFTAEKLANLDWPHPRPEEQKRIANYLDSHCARIDSLISKSTEMIETLREYRSALITNAVTGKIDVREAV